MMKKLTKKEEAPAAISRKKKVKKKGCGCGKKVKTNG